MFEFLIMIVALFLYGYCYYKSNVNRSKLLIEKILDKKDKEENNDAKDKI